MNPVLADTLWKAAKNCLEAAKAQPNAAKAGQLTHRKKKKESLILIYPVNFFFLITTGALLAGQEAARAGSRPAPGLK